MDILPQDPAPRAQWLRLLEARRPIFVTGTDTDVGKTWVSTAILRALHRAGLRPAYFKPFETGCQATHGSLQSTEVQYILRTAGAAVGSRVSCAYRFAPPLAPYTAAMKAGVVPDFKRLDSILDGLQQDADIVVIEGAGGLLVPVTKDVTYLQLLQHWQASPLMVVGNKLGCVNHALLTETVLKQAGYLDTPVVLNDVAAGEPGAAAQTNQWTLEATLGRPLLAHLAHGEAGLDEAVTAAVGETL